MSKRGVSPSSNILPLPLDKGKGIKGIGLLKINGGGVNKQSLESGDLRKSGQLLKVLITGCANAAEPTAF